MASTQLAKPTRWKVHQQIGYSGSSGQRARGDHFKCQTSCTERDHFGRLWATPLDPGQTGISNRGAPVPLPHFHGDITVQKKRRMIPTSSMTRSYTALLPMQKDNHNGGAIRADLDHRSLRDMLCNLEWNDRVLKHGLMMNKKRRLRSEAELEAERQAVTKAFNKTYAAIDKEIAEAEVRMEICRQKQGKLFPRESRKPSLAVSQHAELLAQMLQDDAIQEAAAKEEQRLRALRRKSSKVDESVAQAQQEPIPVSKSAEEVQAEAVKEWDAKPKEHEDEEEGFVLRVVGGPKVDPEEPKDVEEPASLTQAKKEDDVEHAHPPPDSDRSNDHADMQNIRNSYAAGLDQATAVFQRGFSSNKSD